MYRTCPKCGHDNTRSDTAVVERCPACGVIFAKWLKRRYADRHAGLARPARHASRGSGAHWRHWLDCTFLDPRPRYASHEVYGRLLLYFILLVWGGYFISLYFGDNEIGRSFMHRVNLPFHEAGHMLFRPFGFLMTYLGGSLFQVLMPLSVVAVFLIRQRDAFAASVGLWWTGQSLMDVAPYINDARARVLPLLGGGTGSDSPGKHDWHNILLDLGWLHHDARIAHAVDAAGEGVVLLALLWGGVVLYRQFLRMQT